jgi:membrane-bound lytic murein transglycosylase A
MNAASAKARPISRITTHILAVIVLAAGCVQLPRTPAPCPQCPPPKPAPESARYEAVPFADLPGWNHALMAPSLRAFSSGCRRFGPLCELAASVPADDERAAREFFEANFNPYALISSETGDGGLITGYYEPLIEGSRAQNPLHRFPIFGVPEDLVVVDLVAINPDLRNLRLRGRLDGRRLIPYYSRAEIDARRTALPAPVIAWTADPVELFFLQVQGSGQIQLDSGERIRAGFADQNGHPYRSLGRYLVERGEMPLEQASMQGIKAWAAANPGKLQDALNYNASYVFFRELPAADGPIGALNIALTAEYSLAVDRRFVPLGSPVYVASTYPLSEERLERLMAAHDTGGAIRGVVRADFFWGGGKDAGALAGRMRQQGKMWLLWPRGEPLPRAD